MKYTRPIKEATKTVTRLPKRVMKDGKHVLQDVKSGFLRTPARIPKRLMGLVGRSKGDIKGALKSPIKLAGAPLKLLKKIF